MAKKKTSSRRASNGDAKKSDSVATTTAAADKKPAVKKPVAKKSAAKKTATKKPAAKKSSAKKTTRLSGDGGLFLPGGGSEQTAAEKSLANAVLAADGTDKLLTILKHVEAAGGTSSALEALEVYERMRRVLNPTNNETVSHPLFESLDKPAENKNASADQ